MTAVVLLRTTNGALSPMHGRQCCCGQSKRPACLMLGASCARSTCMSVKSGDDAKLPRPPLLLLYIAAPPAGLALISLALLLQQAAGRASAGWSQPGLAACAAGRKQQQRAAQQDGGPSQTVPKCTLLPLCRRRSSRQRSGCRAAPAAGNCFAHLPATAATHQSTTWRCVPAACSTHLLAAAPTCCSPQHPPFSRSTHLLQPTAPTFWFHVNCFFFLSASCSSRRCRRSSSACCTAFRAYTAAAEGRAKAVHACVGRAGQGRAPKLTHWSMRLPSFTANEHTPAQHTRR